jgi:uncharacterized repeat protein (TIGR03803 family)
MTKPGQLFPSILRSFQRTALLLTISCVLPMLAVKPAQTQTFTVIHAFTGGRDGGNPSASLTIDGAGNLYGTTYGGGGVIGNGCAPSGCGVVFKMSHHSAGWVLTPLYPFYGQTDGAGPVAPVIFGPDGLLYGSTTNGGRGDCIFNFIGCGVVFTVQPSATACHTALCGWIEDPIYQFQSQTDGAEPTNNLAFDPAGHLYGTTYYGGTASCFGYGCGTVFQLTSSGPPWTKAPVYNFTGQADGAFPTSGIVIDRLGVLYGTTEGGGANNFGTVFRVTPSASGWTEAVIYNFQNGHDGASPSGGLVIDTEGNLYGTTVTGGTGGGGTVFELSPSGAGWTFSLLSSLSGPEDGGPEGALALDGAGNLYGTTLKGGAHQCGNVFKLTQSGGQWTYRDLYDFTCGDDGGYPEAGVTLDASGNIYGTADGDGPNQNCAYGYGTGGCGVVWEITP